MDAAMDLNICIAKSYFAWNLLCQKQYRPPRRKHERPRCTVLIEALVKIKLFIGYISDEMWL